MIELRDTVEVDVPPDRVWDWLQHLPEHYLEWHPDHLSARWVGGCTMVPGALLEFREVLHGKPHRLRLHLTEVPGGADSSPLGEHHRENRSQTRPGR
ncbi:SRPBCC family protein [Nocardioides pakistanensis]